jgi:hypothetical protein
MQSVTFFRSGWIRFAIAVTIATLGLSAPAVATAATIVSQTSSFSGILGGSTISIQWTQANTWNNVVVTTDFGTNNGAGSTVAAFLNRDGTAIGNQVATNPAVPVPPGISTQVVFTGLTLPPGSYFLTYQPADGLTGFAGGGAPTPITTGSGVTSPGTFTLGASGYPPAGTPSAFPSALRFSVVGDIVAIPTLGKAFNPATINGGGISTLTVTLSNPDAAVATLTGPLVDTLPSGVVIAPTPNASTTCGGSGAPVAVAGGSTVTLPAGRSIPASGSCTLTVDVTSTVGGPHNNTLPANALVTSNGNNAAPAAATLTVILLAIAIPTLSEWAMLMLAVLLAIAGLAAIRRRRR